MMLWRRGEKRLVVGLILVCLGWGSVGVSALQAEDLDARDELVRVPVAELLIEETTVSVSVLDDPVQPVRRLLELCNSLGETAEGHEESELAAHLRAFCLAAERLTGGLAETRHELQPGPYVVSVPLGASRGALRSVLWKAGSLEDAVTFVELLHSGTLKAVTVARRPARPGGAACTDCPIQDLVFSAEGVKDVLKQERRAR